MPISTAEVSAGAAGSSDAHARVNLHTLQGWHNQAAIDAGERPGTTTTDAKRIKELKAEKRS